MAHAFLRGAMAVTKGTALLVLVVLLPALAPKPPPVMPPGPASVLPEIFGETYPAFRTVFQNGECDKHDRGGPGSKFASNVLLGTESRVYSERLLVVLQPGRSIRTKCATAASASRAS